MVKLRNILNAIFVALAIASVVLYFTAGFRTFIIVALIACFFKLMEFVIRFLL